MNELTKGIYWVGAVDWNARNFHGYTTDLGTTYNAYLIIDEKITLIDTVKKEFASEMIDRITQIIEPSSIDYIISNHVEMDHSGSIPEIMEICPNATIVTSSPNGILGLKKHYGEYKYQEVKSGDSLLIGKRSINFLNVPMVHWPDNMMSYCPEEKILFSNDAFGQHYASTKHFDDENEMGVLVDEAAKYYANIVMPYGAQVQKALISASSLEINMIATSHGVIWRKDFAKILELYDKWSKNEIKDQAVIVYDSMWHSTEKMAKAVLNGFEEANIEAKLFDLKFNHISDIVKYILESKYIIVGSPTLNNNIMPTVSAFLTYLKGLAPKGRKGFAFGSYGWGGQSIEIVEEQLQSANIEIIMDKIRIQYIPSKEDLEVITNNVHSKLK